MYIVAPFRRLTPPDRIELFGHDRMRESDSVSRFGTCTVAAKGEGTEVRKRKSIMSAGGKHQEKVEPPE